MSDAEITPVCTACGEHPRARLNGGSRPTRPEYQSLCQPCRIRARVRDAQRRKRVLLAPPSPTALEDMVARIGGWIVYRERQWPASERSA